MSSSVTRSSSVDSLNSIDLSSPKEGSVVKSSANRWAIDTTGWSVKAKSLIPQCISDRFNRLRDAWNHGLGFSPTAPLRSSTTEVESLPSTISHNKLVSREKVVIDLKPGYGYPKLDCVTRSVRWVFASIGYHCFGWYHKAGLQDQLFQSLPELKETSFVKNRFVSSPYFNRFYKAVSDHEFVLRDAKERLSCINELVDLASRNEVYTKDLLMVLGVERSIYQHQMNQRKDPRAQEAFHNTYTEEVNAAFLDKQGADDYCWKNVREAITNQFHVPGQNATRTSWIGNAIFAKQTYLKEPNLLDLEEIVNLPPLSVSFNNNWGDLLHQNDTPTSGLSRVSSFSDSSNESRLRRVRVTDNSDPLSLVNRSEEEILVDSGNKVQVPVQRKASSRQDSVSLLDDLRLKLKRSKDHVKEINENILSLKEERVDFFTQNQSKLDVLEKERKAGEMLTTRYEEIQLIEKQLNELIKNGEKIYQEKLDSLQIRLKKAEQEVASLEKKLQKLDNSNTSNSYNANNKSLSRRRGSSVDEVLLSELSEDLELLEAPSLKNAKDGESASPILDRIKAENGIENARLQGSISRLKKERGSDDQVPEARVLSSPVSFNDIL